MEQNYIASLNRKILSAKSYQAPEISGGNIVSIEAIVTGEPRSAPEGTSVIGGSNETPCNYLIYADKKLKSKIKAVLRKASM